MNAVCKGCTSWQANDGSEYVLNGTGTTQFAWARGGSAVATPSSNTSDFSVHQDFGKWTHDLNAARSSSFNSWVSSNALPKPSATSTSASSTSGVATSSPTTLKTTTTAASGPTGKATIPSTCSGAGAPVFSSVLASGWKATKVLGGLTSPRSLVWDSAGNLLMVQSGKGITVHKVGADGCITSSATLVALNSLNHGITFSADGKTLYASSMTTVYSWPYTASSQTVGTRSTVITGMFNGGAHTTRTLLIGAHAPNLLVVSHGSSENLDAPCINPATGRAIIKVFDLSKLPSSGYNYVSGGYVMGYGLRNDVGITFDGNNMSVVPSLMLRNRADNVLGFGALKTVPTNSREEEKIFTTTILPRNLTTLETSQHQTTIGMGIRHASRCGRLATSPVSNPEILLSFHQIPRSQMQLARRR